MNTKAMFVPLVLTFIVSGCAIREGNQRHVNPPTLGAELIDLQSAYEQGALGDLEYRKLRQKLLDSRAHDDRSQHSHKDVRKSRERGHEH